MKYTEELILALEGLTLWRPLLKEPLIESFHRLIGSLSAKEPELCDFIGNYGQFINRLLSREPHGTFKTCISQLVIYSENTFGERIDALKGEPLPEVLLQAAALDLRALSHMADLDPEDLKKAAVECFSTRSQAKALIEALPNWPTDWDDKDKAQFPGELFHPGLTFYQQAEALARFHSRSGSGAFARYRAFIWERTGSNGRLSGILSPDPVEMEDFIGYEQQRKLLIDNTLQFLRGLPANNILLYGDRGTGKSASVKALLNAFGEQGLRMIEIPKKHLADFHEVLEAVSGSTLKFIVFIDDLAFEDSEESYTSLKALLEGGLRNRPDNLVIYATSNRRHLIKEKFSERRGMLSDNPDEEVHASDAIQEKLSLADRFGMTITYSAPDQEQFLEIAAGIAEKRELRVDPAYLRKEAIRWEMRYNGRSPRTARQFVTWLEGQVNNKTEE